MWFYLVFINQDILCFRCDSVALCRYFGCFAGTKSDNDDTLTRVETAVAVSHYRTAYNENK